MATNVLGLHTFTASEPWDFNIVNDNSLKIDNGVKTAMQGRAVYNILHNSDFSIAQAGYGGNHGETKFAADMWPALPSVSGVLNNGQEITFTSTSDYGGIYQKVKVERIGDGDSFTFAFRYKSPGGAFTKISRIKSDGTYLSDIKNTWFDANANDFNLALITISRDEISESDMLIFNIQSTTAGTITIKHPVLYKGAYTADTLPAYVPKDNELAECQRYYRHQVLLPAVKTSGNIYLVSKSFDVPMRAVPTYSFVKADVYGVGTFNDFTECYLSLDGAGVYYAILPTLTSYNNVSLVVNFSCDL